MKYILSICAKNERRRNSVKLARKGMRDEAYFLKVSIFSFFMVWIAVWQYKYVDYVLTTFCQQMVFAFYTNTVPT